MKKVLWLVLAGLTLQSAAAHAQQVRGRAVEGESREPVAGALVELLAQDASRLATATTDSAGAFLLVPRRAGDFIIRVTHLGYLPIDSAALTVPAGETVEVELRLTTQAIALEPLVVTSRGDRRLREFHERMSRRGFGRFLSRDEIEQRPGARPSELLRGMPGIQLVPATPAGTGNLITMRGGGASGRCLPTIYIDGLPTYQHGDLPVDSFLQSAMLEGVEVYTGLTAPAALHARTGCGVVAFWTRRDLDARPFAWRRMFTAAGVVAAFLAVTSLLTR
jgi:hypothetical protein